MSDWDFSGLRAMFVNCTLKRVAGAQPHPGPRRCQRGDHAQARCRGRGHPRSIDHDVATGVYPDMREHGWETDAWPELYPERSSQRHPRRRRPDLAGGQLERDEAGHRAALRPQRRCSTTRASTSSTGGSPGASSPATRTASSTARRTSSTASSTSATRSRRNADAGWIGEAGPGPSYLDPGSGGPENDFTNRNTTFMTWNLMHLAKLLHDAGGIRPTATSAPRGTPVSASSGRTRSTAEHAQRRITRSG